MAAAISVRYWAGAARAAGRDTEALTATTVGELRGQLAERPALARIAAVASFLVDGKQAADDTALSDGAEVDVLPPFAGGSVDPGDEDSQRLAAAALAQDQPTAWFERLYAAAATGAAIVPWDRGAPNVLLIDWLAAHDVRRGRAIVVGCGYGHDAEYLAGLGFDTTAFDISATAIEHARVHHPGSTVRYEVADLLALPDAWRAAFDLVVEIRNVQSLPPALHGAAAAAVSSSVAPGGTLFVVAAVADGDADGPPWPLTRAELDLFAVDGVVLTSLDELADPAGGVRRWRAEFNRVVK